MKITWLGQAGLLFETEGKMILIDPYFSNSVSIKEPEKYRRVKIKNEYLNLSPDVVICTHDHLDHTDPETLRNYFTYNSQITGLAPFSAWNKLKKFGGEKNNYVLFNEGTEWTEKGITFYAVHAEHSDKYGIGIVFTAEKKSYYITGDTLYNKKIFESLPDFKFYMTFLPINGMGNNMNCEDAMRFANKLKTKYVVPIHYGMFDDIDSHEFKLPNTLRLTAFTSIII